MCHTLQDRSFDNLLWFSKPPTLRESMQMLVVDESRQYIRGNVIVLSIFFRLTNNKIRYNVQGKDIMHVSSKYQDEMIPIKQRWVL